MRQLLCGGLRTVVVTFLTLAAAAMLPLGGVANAASPSTCPVSEGHYCKLVISTPESVAAGQTFTVAVAVTTGGDNPTIAKGDACASNVIVTLRISGGDFPQTLYSKASGGIATFDISLANDVPDTTRTYRLDASAGASSSYAAAATTANCSGYQYIGDYADVNAVYVPPGQPIAACPNDVSCTQVVNTTGSAATLSANDGIFDAKFIDFTTGCGTLQPADTHGVLKFDLSDASLAKTVVFALSAKLINKGIGQFNICWSGKTLFTPLGGGSQVTQGLLPNCKNNDTGPCVLFRKSGQGNVGYFGILAPPGDPQAYPG